jgi:hypothetical protein
MAEPSKENFGVLVEDKDLKQLEELDPSQSDGYRSVFRTMVPCTIRLVDEEEGDVVDRQEVVINVLEKVLTAPTQRKQGELANMRLEISSEVDLYFNFASKYP